MRSEPAQLVLSSDPTRPGSHQPAPRGLNTHGSILWRLWDGEVGSMGPNLVCGWYAPDLGSILGALGMVGRKETGGPVTGPVPLAHHCSL